MGDSTINIIINTLKRGTGDKDTKAALKMLESGFKSITGLSLSYAGAISATVAVGKKLIDFTNQAIEATSSLATKEDDLARLTGNNVEQSGRLIQACDDLFISYDKLSTVMAGAAKKGTDLSISSLEALSEQYLSLNSTTEQNLFLNEKFGKSGLDIKKFMELGAKGIEEKMAAVSDSIVMDEKAVRQTIAYKESVDALNDAIDGFKISIGKTATPAVTKYNNQLAETIDAVNESKAATKAYEGALYVLEGALAGVQVLFHGWKEDLTEGGSTAVDWSWDIANGYEVLSTATGEATGMIVANTMATLDNKDALSAGLKGAIQDATKAEDASYASILKTTKELINQKIVAGLSGDAAYKMATKLGIMSDADYAAVLAAEAMSKAISDNTLDMDTGARMAADLAANIAMMEDKHITVTTDYVSNYISNYANYNTPSQKSTSGSGYGKNNQDYIDEHGTGRAAGGDFAAFQTIRVGEKGPETVKFPIGGTVIPNGESAGTSVIINVNGAQDARLVAKLIMKEMKLQGARV